eukprot:scaffold43714_cov175-Skeletonema_marinoi.AAC.1
MARKGKGSSKMLLNHQLRKHSKHLRGTFGKVNTKLAITTRTFRRRRLTDNLLLPPSVLDRSLRPSRTINTTLNSLATCNH